MPNIVLSLGRVVGVDWRIDDWENNYTAFGINPFFFWGSFGLGQFCQAFSITVTITSS